MICEKRFRFWERELAHKQQPIRLNISQPSRITHRSVRHLDLWKSGSFEREEFQTKTQRGDRLSSPCRRWFFLDKPFVFSIVRANTGKGSGLDDLLYIPFIFVTIEVAGLSIRETNVSCFRVHQNDNRLFSRQLYQSDFCDVMSLMRSDLLFSYYSFFHDWVKSTRPSTKPDESDQNLSNMKDDNWLMNWFIV
jgi:hypothetical protein